MMASIKSVSKSRGHALSFVARKRHKATVRLTCGLLLAYHWLTNGGASSSALGVLVARKAYFNPATILQWQVRAADRAAGVPACGRPRRLLGSERALPGLDRSDYD